MRTESVGAISTSEIINSEFVTMENFGFVQPFFKGIWQSSHREDHGRDLLIQSHEEVDASSKLVFKLGFGGKVLELIDVVLEAVIGDSVFVFSRFLVQPRDMGLFSDVKGTEVLFIAIYEVGKDFIFCFDAGIVHFIIPGFRGEDSFSGALFAEDESDFDFIIGIDFFVDRKVGFHGLDPLRGL